MSDFTMYRYSNKVWLLTFTENGVAVNITGSSIYFALRDTFPPSTVTDDTGAIISKSTTEGSISIIDGANGKATLTFLKANTLNLRAGDYYYAIKRIPSGYSEGRTEAEGIFTINDDVVRAV